jgi:hypothetical protein
MPFDNATYEDDVTRTLRAAWALIDAPHKWLQEMPVLHRADGDAYCSTGAINATVSYRKSRALNEACVRALYLAMPVHEQTAGSGTEGVRGYVMNYNDVALDNHGQLREWWDAAIVGSLTRNALVAS